MQRVEHNEVKVLAPQFVGSVLQFVVCFERKAHHALPRLLLCAKGRLPRKPVVMGIFGFLTMLCFVGPLLDTCSVFLALPVINLETVWPLYMSGFPVNLSQGVCTFLTILLFGNALLEKLDRVKVQYGMTEDEDGL